MNKLSDATVCIVSFLLGALLAVVFNSKQEPVVILKTEECIEARLYLNKSELMVICGKVVDKPFEAWHAKN